MTDDEGRPTPVELATKIVVEGNIVEQAAAQPLPDAPQAVRPVSGGNMIRTTPFGRGTLGVNIDYRGAYQLLGNAHVLTQYDPGRIGAMIYNPPNMERENELVPITWQQDVTYYPNPEQPDPVFNVMDVATAVITPALGDPEIILIGVPGGVRAFDPATDADISFVGAATGLHTFEVESFQTRYRSIGFDSSGNTIYSWWERGIRYKNPLGELKKGDSGAALVSGHDQYVIGLHRADSDGFGYGCPLM
ncbi:hypothetical protein ACQPYK_46320 [Streptosporangium sp. CA-135522]|uniref:hypothetical protein n=1 Tax=Streptosporangium sp. CA-135522 TaxID=3240072 RepID=UPI003D9198CF